MAKHQKQNTWKSLEEQGTLQARHILMALDLGMNAWSIVEEHAQATDRGNSILLEWVEDRFFAKYGHYCPVSNATPENQAEHPAENSLLADHGDAISQLCQEMGLSEFDEEAFEHIGHLIEQREKETPISYGEIYEADQCMLRRQVGFRNAARIVAEQLAILPEVRQVRIFGSVALPMWKEISRHHRFRRKNIHTYHECNNIDLAVWVTSPKNADRMRKISSHVVHELNEKDIYLELSHHTFSTHLIDQTTNRYLGMVCHFNKCPKHKHECRVPDCGKNPFVRILPWFQLKPERLNEYNSQILFQRPL